MEKPPHVEHERMPPRPRARLDLRLALALVLLSGSAGISAYLLWRDPRAHAAQDSEMRVLGRAWQPQAEPNREAEQLARVYLQKPLTLQIAGKKHARSRGALGVRVDLPALRGLLQGAAEAYSPLRRLHAQQRGDAPLDLPIPARLEADRAERWLRALADDYDAPAHPTRVAFDTGEVLAPRAGRQLDVQGTLDALADAIFLGRSKVSAKLIEPSPARSSFEPGSIVDVSGNLGSFESSTDHNDAPRSHNLEAAARKLDGALIAPGETFDVAAELGPLRKGRDFVLAGVSLEEGDLLEAAVSQVASTIYAAALFAGLPIVEHHAPARPSAAIEVGFEAAIAAGKTLRFRNDLRHPIAIAVHVHDGRVQASIRGAALHTREVDIERSIAEVTPYAEVLRADPTLPPGALVPVQRGRPGLHVQLTRTVRETDDATGEPEERVVVYAAAPHIVRAGSADGQRAVRKAAAPTPNVAHAPEAAPRLLAEPLFDQTVSFGMRRGFALPQEHERHAGHTGAPGWTAQHGP